MKTLFIITVIILCGMVLNAQESFFPTREGALLVYKTYDKKDKLINMVKYTIKHVSSIGSNLDITYEFESIDPKDKPVFKEEITIHQKGDKLYFDMSNYINKAVFKQNGEIPSELDIKGNNMEIPLNPQPGDILSDANVERALKVGFMNMKISAELTNRKVEAIEDITVKGGTFICYKFSSDINSSAMGIKVKGKSTEWYAKGIGIVKSESYDKNGVLQGRTELVEVK